MKAAALEGVVGGIAHQNARYAAHLFLGWRAGKLEILKLKHGLGHFRSKAQPYVVGSKALYQQLAFRTA
ncbi:MAG: hypothetical protein EOO56_03960 [Hymenobacter sp.]|nr:MAG: hypothetical protein EOO56_03960 [Hymenobacter sp.]